MNTYKSSAQLKGMSKEQLFGHYGTVIGALFLVGIISLVADSIPSSLIRKQHPGTDHLLSDRLPDNSVPWHF